VVIVLLWVIPQQHASFGEVSAKTINHSGMFGGSTSGWGFLLFVLPISAILTQYTITGYDASAHLSEETKGPANAAANGIWRSIFYSAIGGWILLLSFLFAVQDADGVSKRGGAVAVIFNRVMSAKWVALILFISTAGQFCCTTACQTSASRMLFAFSRDRAVPDHQLWSSLSAKRVPANGVIVTAVLAAIITLHHECGAPRGDIPSPGDEAGQRCDDEGRDEKLALYRHRPDVLQGTDGLAGAQVVTRGQRQVPVLRVAQTASGAVSARSGPQTRPRPPQARESAGVPAGAPRRC
jgi:hypothetical protein